MIKFNVRLMIYLLSITVFIVGEFSGCIEWNYSIDQDECRDILIVGVINSETIYPYRIISDNLLLVFSNMFDGLVEFDEIFRIVPGLAVSWTNPDDVTWRFNLRRNVQFHNGSKFTAKDVKYCFDMIYASSKPFIKEVVILNNYTVDFITNEPYPAFLQSLAQNFLVYSEDILKNADDIWPVGTGPYKLADYIEGNITTLERFEEYWGELPPIKTVQLKVIPDKQDRIDALLSGEIDIAEYNVDDNVKEIVEYNGINIITYPPLSTYILGFDLRENNSYGYQDGKNPTADIRVRKALYHAIDIEPLISGPFQDLASPVSQLLTPYIFGYNPEIKRLSYNQSRARDYLKEAGYEYGFNITLDCITEGYEYNLEHCNMIVEQLAEIGVNVTLNTLTMNEFNQKVVYEKNTSMYLVGWSFVSVDGGSIYNLILMTEDENITGYLNSGHYSNSMVDLLGKQAATEMNPRKRLELLQEGFHIALVDDVILVPLLSQNLFYFTTEEIVMEPRADLRLLFEDIAFKEEI